MLQKTSQILEERRDMIIVTKKVGETINLSSKVKIHVNGIFGDRVRLGIIAPRHIIIDRQEIHEKKIIEQKISHALNLEDKVK
jgi:carbon storage regulator